MRKKVTILILTIVLIFAFALSTFAASQGVDHARKTIKIGWFGPLSGAFQKIGEGMVDGMLAFVDRQNARGGVGGYKVVVKFLDNNNDPIQSKQAVKTLVQQERVFAIVGALGSKGINAVVSDMEKYGIPVVYLGGGETHWAVPPKKNIFPVQPDYIMEGRLMVKFAIENLNSRRLAFIYRADDNSGRTALVGVKQAMAQLGRRFGAQMVLETRRDAVQVLVAKIKSANPDAVIVFDFFGGASGVVSASKKAGINTNWITTYVNSDAILYKMTGKAWLGVYIGMWAKMVEPNVTEYIKYFKTTKYYTKAISRGWDAPSGYNTAGWIAAEIFYGGLQIFMRKYRTMAKLDWDNYIRSMEDMRGFNNTLAKDITYFPMSEARRGTAKYYLARSGQRTMFFGVASLTPQGQFYFKPVTNWLR